MMRNGSFLFLLVFLLSFLVLLTGCDDIVPEQFSLAINVIGEGKVTPSADGESHVEGSQVQLTATPDSGWVFSHWTGAATGTDNPVMVTMDADKAVSAVFNYIEILHAPIFGTGDSAARAIDVGTANPEWVMVAWAPVVTGVTENNGTYTDGETFSIDFLGETMEILVTKDQETGDVIYDGTISNGCGGFKMTFHPAANTFDYEQYVIMRDERGDATNFFLIQIMEDVAFDENYHYHTIYDFYWQQTMDNGDQNAFFHTQAEYFYGIGENDLMVSGWVTWYELLWYKPPGTAFNGGAVGPLMPNYGAIDQYRAAMNDEANWGEVGEPLGLYMFMEDGVIAVIEYIEDGQQPQPIYYFTVDQLHNGFEFDNGDPPIPGIPWTTLLGP